MDNLSFDTIIIGSGSAGLSLARHLDASTRVLLLSKACLSAGATRWAQGGIASVFREDDDISLHIEDTIKAGAGLCDPTAVQEIISRGPSAMQWLISEGMPFDESGAGTPHLAREGGHCRRRVWHVADATGAALSKTLLHHVRQAPHITCLSDHYAVDLIKSRDGSCIVGVYAYDQQANQVKTYMAPTVVLATGGASRAYQYTTNPDVASGDGIAMAYRAGCQIKNMEFNQFHPTCLYHPKAGSFLLTEALRGEGGILTTIQGEKFMPAYHEDADLAPRDVVARAIDDQMKKNGDRHVLLDVRHLGSEVLHHHFPTILARCADLGIDILTTPIPVVPAAHYTCGGIATDVSGHTDIPGLYAIGETACTGLHGANRLASNSLLECLVMAESCAESVQEYLEKTDTLDESPSWDASWVTPMDEQITIAHDWDELRLFMSNYVGIVRTTKRLEQAKRRLELVRAEVNEAYAHHVVTRNLLELRNLIEVSDLIITSALLRQESRGLHFTLDYPDTSTIATDTILKNPNA